MIKADRLSRQLVRIAGWDVLYSYTSKMTSSTKSPRRLIPLSITEISA